MASLRRPGGGYALSFACAVHMFALVTAFRRPVVRMSIQGHRELALLPFSADECLLPGESKRVHLYEARLLSMFEDAIGLGRGGETSPLACGEIGHVLVSPSGGGVVQVLTVCGITDWRKEEVGVSATLVAQRRGRLVDVTAEEPYLTGLVMPYDDTRPSLQALAALDAGGAIGAAGEEAPEDEAAVTALRALAEDVRWLLEDCEEREGTLGTGEEEDDAMEDEDGMAWGHYKQGGRRPFGDRLAAAVQALHPGLTGAGEGERANLLSFLAASGLQPTTAPIQALQSRSVFDRLELAKMKLHEKRKLLVAKQSLFALGSGGQGTGGTSGGEEDMEDKNRGAGI